MKYGIFSDVHANLEAFAAVLKELARVKVDKYIFAGDIVGYGADPAACITILQELIEKKGCLCVAGNHDYAVCKMTDIEYFNWAAKEGILWTQAQLGENEKKFLKNLKLTESQEGFTIVHASLNEPQEWHYLEQQDDTLATFALLKEQICFAGHTHQPGIFTLEKTINFSVVDQLALEDACRYIINAGSVGQPRDGDPRACYFILDTVRKNIIMQRVSYDVALAQEKIRKAGLPKVLADRLSLGQ